MKRVRALNFGYGTKYRLVLVGSCLVVYKKSKDKYQKWQFRVILKDDSDKYYEFTTLELENADVRLFDISNCEGKNLELIIYDKKIESRLKFKIIKYYNKFWVVLDDKKE